MSITATTSNPLVVKLIPGTTVTGISVIGGQWAMAALMAGACSVLSAD